MKFKEYDIVLYLNHYLCFVKTIGEDKYLIKQLDNDKLWIAHENDLKLYERDDEI